MTDKRLIVYKQWFEEKAEHNPERKTKNLSPGGIKISGFEYHDPADLISFPEIRDSIETRKQTIRRKTGSEKKAVEEGLLRGIRKLVTELNTLSSLAGESIDLINAFESSPEEYSIGKILQQLDANDKKILKLKSKKITGFLIQPIIEEMSKNITGTENSLDRSRRLYSEIKRSCDFHIGLLELYVKNYKVSGK